jgi:serine/threonine protein kinase
MTKLGELYSDFFRIDRDARGGYARVAEVKTQKSGLPELCALKLMRHENDYNKSLLRAEEELRLLAAITKDQQAPLAITRIYDSGFVPQEVSLSLHNQEKPDPTLEIYSTGTDLQSFQEMRIELQEQRSLYWLPYLVVELAPFDDSLLRQIHSQPQDDTSALFRFATGEVIAMSLQLLDVMQYLHSRHHRAYMDWKPEHIYWNGKNGQVKLIDWNVTTQLSDELGEVQNIRDDLRLFCGAVLYIGLTFVDPEKPTVSIGPRPTEQLEAPVSEIRRRYWTDKPNFYQRDSMLDEHIKDIVRQGLDPKQGFESVGQLKEALMQYAREELGMTEAETYAQPTSPYFKALQEVHLAQEQLFQAQEYLKEAISETGSRLEFTRLFESIKRALKNFPLS